MQKLSLFATRPSPQLPYPLTMQEVSPKANTPKNFMDFKIYMEVNQYHI